MRRSPGGSSPRGVTPVDELGVSDLDGAVVSRFLLGECGRVCLGSAKGKVAVLRFLHVRGLTPRSLAESVPGVAGWRETTIPPTMPQADIEALLASCDHSTLDGVRDHAMLTLLARLGLRSIEIARLRLEDLDWRAGDLLVRGKARFRARRRGGCRIAWR
jgi:integrase/recombinase XerD